ncbi:hypothetical protein ACFL67_04120 [candidate division KSB1 bacterium]
MKTFTYLLLLAVVLFALPCLSQDKSSKDILLEGTISYLEISRSNTNIMYAMKDHTITPVKSGKRLSFNITGDDVGLYKTTDGGKTWKHLSEKLFAAVSIHDNNPHVVYAIEGG